MVQNTINSRGHGAFAVFVSWGPIFAFFLALGCSPPDKKTPESAFARLAPCLEKSAPECLFEELNRDSQWSLQTIFRTLGEIRQLARQSYPKENIDEAFGSWAEEAKTSSPEEMFRVYCQKRNCLKPLVNGFGAVKRVVAVSESRVRVETTRGHRFELIQNEGRYGIALYDEELMRAKIRLLDRLEQVRKNAREFEDQKLATEGDVKPPAPLSGQSQEENSDGS